MRILISFVLFLFAGVAAQAQDDNVIGTFGADVFGGGSNVMMAEPGHDDAFLAGQAVSLGAAITGTAHMAGQDVTVAAPVGKDLYAAGMNITVNAPVTGDASVAGYSLAMHGAIGGNLRAAGSQIDVTEPVSGYAVLSGDKVSLGAEISGDVQLSAANVEFGPGAVIGGNLTVYETAIGATEVPGYVMPEDRILRQLIEPGESPASMPRVISWRSMVWSFVKGVLVVAVVAALIAAVVPERLAKLRRTLLSTPFRSLWLGFLAQSTLVGAGIIFAMTLIGIFIAPAAIILALVAGFIGYVVAAYALGVGLMLAVGQSEPDRLLERAAAAAVGALSAGIIALIPYLGWIFVLLAVLAGIGAMTQHLFRPRFFADQA